VGIPALQRGGHQLSHCLARLLGDAQHRRDRVGYRRRIGDRSQLEKPDSVGKFIGQPGRDLQRQPGLADPADTGQRHQPMSLDGRLHLVEFGLACQVRTGDFHRGVLAHARLPGVATASAIEASSPTSSASTPPPIGNPARRGGGGQSFGTVA